MWTKKWSVSQHKHFQFNSERKTKTRGGERKKEEGREEEGKEGKGESVRGEMG